MYILRFTVPVLYKSSFEISKYHLWKHWLQNFSKFVQVLFTAAPTTALQTYGEADDAIPWYSHFINMESWA